MMRYRLTVISMLAALVFAAAPQVSSTFAQGYDDDDHDLRERDEMRQTFQLSPGARVEVYNINGAVEIETANVATAEVYIVRSAESKSDLEYRKVIVEQTDSSLAVHGVEDHNHHNVRVHQRVTLKIPRQVELNLNDINGHAICGEIEGPVHLNDINGKVEVARASDHSKINDINGSVTVTVASLGKEGLELSDINGRVEIKFADELNADLDVREVSGGIYSDLPLTMIVEGKVDRSNMRARIGSGGAPISIYDINGSLHLGRQKT